MRKNQVVPVTLITSQGRASYYEGIIVLAKCFSEQTSVDIAKKHFISQQSFIFTKLEHFQPHYLCLKIIKISHHICCSKSTFIFSLLTLGHLSCLSPHRGICKIHLSGLTLPHSDVLCTFVHSNPQAWLAPVISVLKNCQWHLDRAPQSEPSRFFKMKPIYLNK